MRFLNYLTNEDNKWNLFVASLDTCCIEKLKHWSFRTKFVFEKEKGITCTVFTVDVLHIYDSINVKVEVVCQSDLEAVLTSLKSTLTQARVIWEEWTFFERSPPPDWPLGILWCILFGWWYMRKDPAHCRWCHSWADGSEYCQEAGWASRDNKQVSSTPPWPEHAFLSPCSDPPSLDDKLQIKLLWL